LIVSVSAVLAVCGVGVEESVTLNVNEAFVIGAIGVPLSTPVAELNVSPFGSVPPTMDHV
jgi:hypothetical protein